MPLASYRGATARGQRWPKPLPVLIALTHGGMARLSGSEWPGKYLDGRPAKGDLTIPVLTGLDVA